MTDQNMDSANEFGVSRKQETIDTLWVKYRKTLEMLNDALDKNESLTEELDDALGRNETLTEDLDDALLENRNLTADLDEHKVELDKKPKEVEVIKEGDIVYYDKHAGHGVQYKDILYQVIRSGDVVLIDT